ncbi:MAG: flagellar protein export ATPase FliI [Pseudomonadota bacterium]
MAVAEFAKTTLNYLNQQLEYTKHYRVYGRVGDIKGMMLELVGVANFAAIGSRFKIITRNNNVITAEAVGFKDDAVVALPFAEITDIGAGCIVEMLPSQQEIYPDHSWRGRIINAFAEPIDDGPPLKFGGQPYRLKESPPNAGKRMRLGPKIELGVKALDVFTSVCNGQRMGIFSGSGVGKSVLISMLAKFSAHSVKVIGLIGERGREVKEFIEDQIGKDGLEKVVIVVATGDEPPLARRQAAFTTMAIAEYFRDQGEDVLCVMDSVTRFAMAQREIGLATGEPPTTKGYPPSMFSELARLLERAGPGIDNGNITGFFSVLVEGDNLQEPVCDTVRGIVDGHIVLSRAIAERSRYPAIDILKSISRTMPGCNSDQQNELIQRARGHLATYEDMVDMIQLGAYKAGTSAEVDNAIKYYNKIEQFIRQNPKEKFNLEQSYQMLGEILK